MKDHLQIEVGNTYRTHKGSLVTITRWEQHNFLFPYIGESNCGIITTYSEHGHVHILGGSPNDLVELVVVDKGDPLESLNLMDES